MSTDAIGTRSPACFSVAANRTAKRDCESLEADHKPKNMVIAKAAAAPIAKPITAHSRNCIMFSFFDPLSPSTAAVGEVEYIERGCMRDALECRCGFDGVQVFATGRSGRRVAALPPVVVSISAPAPWQPSTDRPCGDAPAVVTRSESPQGR
jgi:hypothetical protein